MPRRILLPGFRLLGICTLAVSLTFVLTLSAYLNASKAALRACPALADVQQETQPITALAPGTTSERAMHSGESHIYCIRASAFRKQLS
jgi:hypothetical protein